MTDWYQEGLAGGEQKPERTDGLDVAEWCRGVWDRQARESGADKPRELTVDQLRPLLNENGKKV